MESAKPNSLKGKMEAYFAACDATAERVTLKNGSVTIRQTPYTLAGLSEHLGMPQGEILAKGRSGEAGRRAGCLPEHSAGLAGTSWNARCWGNSSTALRRNCWTNSEPAKNCHRTRKTKGS